MILFTFNEENETRGDTWPCDKFRWTFQANLCCYGFIIGFVQQYHTKDTQKWNDSHTRTYEFGLHTPFLMGMGHFYYDGPHCALSLGFCHFTWNGDKNGRCKKCEGE